jgi:pSer/pThr/pTyr-binding forkhead associated (FHA) protein
VVKGGVQVERFDVSTKDHFVVGRTEGCDVVLLHPSVSRRHAVIQHRAGRSAGDEDDGEGEGGGVFVYDLGSTHGTFVGKRRVGARQYCELRVGDMVRFGASTRLFVLTAPDQEAVRQEEERRLVRRKRAAEERRRYPEHHRQQLLAARRRAGEDMDGDDDDDACGWGMGDDAEEEIEEEMERMDHVDDAEDLFQGTTADAKAFMKRHKQEEREKKLQKMRRKGKKAQLLQQQQQAAAEEAHAAKKERKEQEQVMAADKVEEAKLREEERLRRAVVEEWDDSFDDADDFYDRAGRTRAFLPSCVRSAWHWLTPLAIALQWSRRR